MPEPFKNRFSPAVVRRFGDLLAAQPQSFDQAAFVATALDGLDALELKDRVRHIAAALQTHLPGTFPEQAKRLTAILSSTINPRPDDGSIDLPDDQDDGVRGMSVMVLTHFVGEYGLEHVAVSLDALGEMTRRCTAEFELRLFIEVDPETTWARIDAWSRSEDVHQRRLASEGTRPFLPWAKRLKSLAESPERNLEVLTRLRDDPSSYVRRSVANHLNDLSKAHPELVLDLAEGWLEDESRRPLIKHALRTLSKQSHPRALGIFGFDPSAPVTLSGFTLGGPVKEGDKLPFAFVLTNEGDASAPILVEYLLHYVKARGPRTAKVFQVARTKIAPGQAMAIERQHDCRRVTTRKHYSGAHRLEVRVNGVVRAGAEFDLSVD